MSEERLKPYAVNEREAARLLSVSAAALRRWRREKRGPQFFRVERLIRYRTADLEAYLAENALPQDGSQ